MQAVYSAVLPPSPIFFCYNKYNVSGELALVLPLAPYFLWEIAGEELTRRKFIVNFAKRTLTQRHFSIQFQSCENFCIKSIDIYIVSNSGASLNWCKLIMDKISIIKHDLARSYFNYGPLSATRVTKF